ncbi:MAG: hypothetical protein V3V00_09490 [Saprospiraceae bacterium]
MHDIEPYHKWRDYYTSEEDESSPFYGREYSEFQYSQKIYNYFVHPQWDFYGSHTMCMKLLYCNYENGIVLIELLGEWNDCINNDIMLLKREIADHLIANGIIKFVLFCDNVLNFHSGDEDYYQEWLEDVIEDNGWICLMNLSEHVQDEMQNARLQNYVLMGDDYNEVPWRGVHPKAMIEEVELRMEGAQKQLRY